MPPEVLRAIPPQLKADLAGVFEPIFKGARSTDIKAALGLSDFHTIRPFVDVRLCFSFLYNHRLCRAGVLRPAAVGPPTMFVKDDRLFACMYHPAHDASLPGPTSRDFGPHGVRREGHVRLARQEGRAGLSTCSPHHYSGSRNSGVNRGRARQRRSVPLTRRIAHRVLQAKRIRRVDCYSE